MMEDEGMTLEEMGAEDDEDDDDDAADFEDDEDDDVSVEGKDMMMDVMMGSAVSAASE